MTEMPEDAHPPRVSGRSKHLRQAAAERDARDRAPRPEPERDAEHESAPKERAPKERAPKSRAPQGRAAKSAAPAKRPSSTRDAAKRPERAPANDPYADAVVLDGVHPAALTDEKLLKACTFNAGRGSGPGGQHRNKVSTAVLLVHEPSGLEGAASERRKQYDNKRMAIWRLRIRLAIKARTRVHWRDHQPSELWESRRQGTQLSVNPKHRDYPALLAEALDVIFARRFDVAGAAGVLGVSISQLAKLLGHEKHAFAAVNAGRERQGLAPLKTRN